MKESSMFKSPWKTIALAVAVLAILLGAVAVSEMNDTNRPEPTRIP